MTQPNLNNFEGAEVQVQIFAPDLNTPIEDPATAVVGDGLEFDDDSLAGDNSFNAPVDIDLAGGDAGSGSISITIDQEQTPGTFFEAEFSGYQFTDVNDQLSAIENVTINESANSLGLEADDITFSEDSIEVNVESLDYEPGLTAALDVDFSTEEESVENSDTFNNFEGAEVQVQIFAPDLNTPIEDPATAVVGDGLEFDDDSLAGDNSFNAPVDIDLAGGDAGSGSISITIDQEQTPGTFFEAEFSGYQFTDVNDQLSAIENVTINESANSLGLEADDITFTEDSIEVNVEGLYYEPGLTAALDVDFATEEESAEEPTFEPVFGSLNGDTIEISGSNQLIFAGGLNDLVDATAGHGGNRIYAGNGNDTLILGDSDRVIAGIGDDSIFTTGSGNNTITGGEGADQFWIASAEIPESANIITDFTSGEDVIGIAGLGIGFEDVSITQTEGDTLISATGSELAIFQGVDAGSLTADDFAFA